MSSGSTNAGQGTISVPKKFKLTLTAKDRPAAEFELEFDDKDWAHIQQYLRYVLEMADLALVENNLWGNVHLKLGSPDNPARPDPAALHEGRLALTGGTMSIDTSTFPSKNDLYALLIGIRPFVMKSDPTTFFPHILNLFSRRAPHDAWNVFRGRYDGKLAASRMQLQCSKDGRTLALNAPGVLDRWLKAFYYHPTPEAAAEFLDLSSDAVGPEVIKGLMLELLAERVTAIVRLGQLIQGMSSEAPSFTIKP